MSSIPETIQRKEVQLLLSFLSLCFLELQIHLLWYQLPLNANLPRWYWIFKRLNNCYRVFLPYEGNNSGYSCSEKSIRRSSYPTVLSCLDDKWEKCWARLYSSLWLQIKELDAINQFPLEFNDHIIPTVEDALKVCSRSNYFHSLESNVMAAQGLVWFKWRGNNLSISIVLCLLISLKHSC